MSENPLKLENGEYLIPQSHHIIECEVHNIKTTWGKLTEIQKLAVYDNIDTTKEHPCILTIV